MDEDMEERIKVSARLVALHSLLLSLGVEHAGGSQI